MRYYKPKKVHQKQKKQKEIKILENEDTQFNEDFKYRHTLLPPYNVILDTNFIIQSIKKKMDIKIEIFKSLSSNFKIWIPQCVFAEIAKLGPKYKISSVVVKNMDYQLLLCDHKGTYADDCIVNRISVHRCYIIATCDTELKNRIRKIPGVPLMYIRGHKYEVERIMV